MARRVLGRAYLVEAGVVATLRGLARSTPYPGMKMAHIAMVDGTEHLFTAENLGPTVTEADGSVSRADRVVGDRRLGVLGAATMMVVAGLPEAVRRRYRLDGVDLVCVDVVPPSHFRAFPDEAW